MAKLTIKRLRLKPGDAIIVSDYSMVASVVAAGRTWDLGFSVPIFVVPLGSSLRRVSKEYLLKVARQIVNEFESNSKGGNNGN